MPCLTAHRVEARWDRREANLGDHGAAASLISQTRELQTQINEFASTTLFRIVQEALTNVARHANASLVRSTARQIAR